MRKKNYWLFFWVGIMIMALTGCASAPASLKQGDIFQLPALIKYPGEEALKIKKEPTKEELIAQERAEKERLTKQPKITNFWEGVDLRTVLQDIASQAKVNIIADETVQGTVTLEVKELPLEKALEMILLPGGYNFKQIVDNYGEYYLVGSGAPESPMALALSESKKIVTNRPAKEVSSLLGPNLFPYVISSEKDYFLSVTAPSRILSKIEEQVNLIDEAHSQIVIEILVCESKWDREKAIGVDWSQLLNLQTAARMAWRQGAEWSYTGTLSASLESSIQALVQKGKVAVKAKPRIAVMEGEEATIDVSTDFYINLYEPMSQIVVPEPPFPYYAYTRYKAEPIKVGVVLRVRPRISREDDKILLNLQSDVSNLIGVKNDGLPLVSRRSVKSVVRVKSGETVVIGGLYQENFQESISGLPGVKIIPLFGTTKSKKEDTELVIFLTPKILRGEIVQSEK